MASRDNRVRTIVLVGRTGNGKSATGNSILGRRAFKSSARSSGVTATCELQRMVQSDGQIVNVIDTPGLFDSSSKSEFVSKEIAKCIELAKDGIHAILLVLSTRARFSKEEEATIRSLQMLFGNKIVKYMIIVFTGGDELERNEETLDDYLGWECPDSLKVANEQAKSLQEILRLCENRVVVFDNLTNNKPKKAEQVQQLLSLVNKVIAQNGGQPYTDEMFVGLKEGAMKLHDQKEELDSLKGYYSKREISELKEQMQNAYDIQLKRITEMIESKLSETTQKLQEQLVVEQAARQRVEEIAQADGAKSKHDILKLKEDLARAQSETEELRKKLDEKTCSIL